MTKNDDQTSDRIEKQIVLKAPIARVFRALTDPTEFGAWFGVRFHSGSFEPGSTLLGKITEPPGYEHLEWTAVVDRVEPPRFMSYRWRPYAIDPGVDYSNEPMTLVSFELSEVPEGTHLRITESGFDGIPSARRAEAFRSNSRGWEIQASHLEKYLASTQTR
ncbi:MAG: hypothetical protein RL701_6264 [Pseudomonadota bacterium]|jgi:uncharacterized protein YndB with AHSA1/START domain